MVTRVGTGPRQRAQPAPARWKGSRVNFCRDVVEAASPDRLALVERRRDGGRATWTFGQLGDRSARLAGTLQTSFGVRGGDVVLLMIGARVEWVEAMLAGFRLGAVVLPVSEQLRPADLRHRLTAVQPAAILADERHRAVLETAAPACPVALLPDQRLYAAEPAGSADLAPTDPCLMTFTSGTAAVPKPVLHAQRYLLGQRLQAEHWLGARDGDLVWCTASPGWSKSARNVFLAPWLRGAAALLHDARFDPAERLAVLAEESVDVLCMAPTEYRVLARQAALPRLPAIHSLVAAGEALDPPTLRAWRDAVGVDIRDGYGQTETGQLTGNRVGRPARPGSMGPLLPGIRAWIDGGELVVDAASVPTFFLGYAGSAPPSGPWRTGDAVRMDDEGYLWFSGRTDDVINSAGYRIGPAEVESVLAHHPAVADSAVVAAPDAERGSVVRAVVVLRAGFTPSALLARELQEHVKAETAPYKYPRIVDFVADLPRTSTGKTRRAALREPSPDG
ncbi:MAG: AMP-binding protein [Frankiaceae bacterium]